MIVPTPRPTLTSPMLKMKVSNGLAIRISPDALRRKIRLSSPPPEVVLMKASLKSYLPVRGERCGRSPLRHLHGLDLASRQRDQHALKDALGINASRIDAHGLADLDVAAPLVDVAVQAQERLMRLDHFVQRAAARVPLPRVAHVEHNMQVVVELGARGEHGAVRRHMDVEDAAAHVLDLRKEPVEALAIFGLGVLALRVPPRLGPAAPVQHLPPPPLPHPHP